MNGPSDTTLPPGMRVRLDRRTRVVDGGAVLLGGAPPRMLRLSDAARALLVEGEVTVDGPTSAALARRLLDAGIAHPVAEPAAAVPPSADVTVVVPVKDRVDGLARLLAALPTASGQAGPGAATAGAAGIGVEPTWSGPARSVATAGTGAVPTGRAPGALGGLVVVDDGSLDAAGIREVVQRAGATVVRHDRARGPAAARNTGLAAARTPLVAFLDSDVVPEPGWLEPLLARLADPAVGLVAPRIVALPPITGWLGTYEAVRSSLDLGVDPALVVPRSRVAYVPSAALLVRCAAVGGGFDERMRVAEDVDLVLRLHAAGWRLRYEPSSQVAHDHRVTLRGWWLRKAFYGTGAAPLALRHRGSVPPMVLSPWSAAVGGLLLLARPWAAVLAVAVSAVAAERLSRKLTSVRRPRATAARLIGLGAVGAVAQTADAVTRHYWPLSVAAAVLSRRARRTVAVVALAEGAVDWWRHRDRDPRVRPVFPAHLLAHRLDDLAYGAGLWWGAVRHRTTEPLRAVGLGADAARTPKRQGRPGVMEDRVPSDRVSPNG